MSPDPSVPCDESLLAPPEDAEVETLRLARSHARFVLDSQLARFDRLTDRTTSGLDFSLLVAAVAAVAAVGVFGPGGRFVNPLTVAGVACLSASVVVGLASLGIRRPRAGIGAGHVEVCLSESYTEAEWLSTLLAEYRGLVAAAAATNRVYAKLFAVTHALTGLGVVLLAVGIALAATDSVSAIAVSEYLYQ